VPYRGKTNSPAYVPFVAQQIAALKGVPVETVAAATSANFERLFKVPPLAPAPAETS
jgi:TatD DNase family protein